MSKSICAAVVATEEIGNHPVMHFITVYLIVPQAWARPLIGIQHSTATRGLMRHRWIAIKPGPTEFALMALLLQTETIRLLSNLPDTTLASTARVPALSSMDLHAGGSILVLPLASVISVYKPRGFTPYGWNRRAA